MSKDLATSQVPLMILLAAIVERVVDVANAVKVENVPCVEVAKVVRNFP